MTTKDEALKLALEALENAKEICIGLQELGIRAGKSAKDMRVGEVLIHDRAITAIREALAEQPAQPIKQGWDVDTLLNKPKQPAQQEPVAWMHNHIEDVVIAHRPNDIDRHPDRWTALYLEPKPCPTCEALARTVMMDQTAHDTSPPASKPWVGLTDDQINELFQGMEPNNGFWLSFGRAIEAKLREKNA